MAFLVNIFGSFSSLIVSAARRKRDIEITLSVGPRAEKFDIVSNDLGRTHKCDFSVFDWKYSFWANLVQKSKLSV